MSFFKKSQNCSFPIQEFDVRWPLMYTIFIKMKRLDVFKHICTNFYSITSSRSQYNQKWIFSIFHIFNCGFDHFGHHFSNMNQFLGTIDFVFSKHHLKPFFDRKCTRYYALLAYTHYILWFFSKTPKSVLSTFLYTAIWISTFTSQMFHGSKVWYLSFQTHFQPCPYLS